MTKGNYIITEEQISTILEALDMIPTTKGYLIMNELVKIKQRPIVIKPEIHGEKNN